MTVKELKERLEILIKEDKGDYNVVVDGKGEVDDKYTIYISDYRKKVYL